MIRIGVAGCGVMGRNHLRVLSAIEGAELVGVCDQSPEAVVQASQKYGVPGYESWREMLDTGRLDAMVVAVPTRFHCDIGVAALERGVHVLVDPAIRELQRRVAAGELGRVFHIFARRLGPFPARIRDVGVVIDLATHDLDVMSHLVGSGVTRVYAETEQRIHTEHEDMLNALVRFETGEVGVLQVNWLTPTKIRELSVLGERGLFGVNYITQELMHYKNADVEGGGDVVPQLQSVSEGDAVRIPITQAEPLVLELQSFLQSIKDGRPAEVDGEAGLRALQLALALVWSATEGRVLGRDQLRELWADRS